MNQLRILAACTGREMTLLHQSDAQTEPRAAIAQRQVQRDSRPVDASAQNQDVERAVLQPRQVCFARVHLLFILPRADAWGCGSYAITAPSVSEGDSAPQ